MAPETHSATFLTVFLLKIQLALSTPSFPTIPPQFRTQIIGRYHLADLSTGSFTLEQSFIKSSTDGSTIEKCLFTADKFYKGTISDSSKNQTLEFTFSKCFFQPRAKDSVFKSYGITSNDGLGFQLVDVLQLFQVKSDMPI